MDKKKEQQIQKQIEMEKEKQARNQMREFDSRLLAARDYDAWLYRVPFWILEGMFMLLGSFMIEDRDYLFWWLGFAYAFCLSLELRSYQKFQDQSVYELLLYYPITKKDICLVRLGYLKDKLLRRLVVLYLMQIPFIAYQKTIPLLHILFPLLYTGIALLCCGLDILWAILGMNENKKEKQEN